MQVALLVKILPNALQERVNEHLDRLMTYKDVHAKIINLVQSSSKYNLNDAMHCSAVDDYDNEFYDDTDVNALAKDQCGRCGGMGHYARDCPTPIGKGKGEGKARPIQESGDASQSGKSGVVCANCNRPGHTKDTCWDFHPELKRKGKGKGGKTRKVAGLDEEQAEEEDILGFIELSALDNCSACSADGNDIVAICSTDEGVITGSGIVASHVDMGTFVSGVTTEEKKTKTFYHIPKVSKARKSFISSGSSSFPSIICGKSYFSVLDDDPHDIDLQVVEEDIAENEELSSAKVVSKRVSVRLLTTNVPLILV